VLLATHSSDRGSTSRTLEGWVRRLPDHGIAPTVTIGGEGPLLDALRSAGVPVEVQPIRVFPSKTWPFPFLAAVLRYARAIRRVGPDLIHVNEHEHYPVVAYAARLTSTPLVVHVRFRPMREHCAWLFKRPYDPVRVFFTSETQQTEVGPNLEGIVPRDRWRLLRNAVDLSAFEPDAEARTRMREAWGLSPGTVALGTASSISPRKRLDHFLRVVSDLRGDGLDVRGFIAGMPYFAEDHAELDRLRRLVSELDLVEAVTLLGYVEPVKPLYDAWDVCFSTSEYESFGMTVLESMACGCPVVAYPGGAVEEVLGDAGMIVPDGDGVALADAARRLVRSPELRAALAERSRRRAACFDIAASTAELAREYRSVAAAGTS
jgi:glycosyltransferase involved in cell wall biosynthesis